MQAPQFAAPTPKELKEIVKIIIPDTNKFYLHDFLAKNPVQEWCNLQQKSQ